MCGTAFGQVALTAKPDRVSVRIHGQPYSDFYFGDAYGKPFLAPLRTASGLVVTRRYSMESVPGESRDHPHHKGLWIGYGDINGVNFWENEIGVPNTDAETPQRQGRIALVKLGRVESGKDAGSLQADFVWRDPEGHELLREDRRMVFTADRDLRIVDVDVAFTALADLSFADTKEGFFAIRVADSMAGKNGGLIRDSTGAQGEAKVWGRRADWVDYSGPVEGHTAGIAIFVDPGNYNYPPRWHARDYGLFAVNPFGLKPFDPQASGKGGYQMRAGAKVRFRYRVVIHDGQPSLDRIAGWYDDWTRKQE